MSDTVRLTEEFRGGLLDLTHYGYISIVDEKGKVIYSAGDPEAVRLREDYGFLPGVIPAGTPARVRRAEATIARFAHLPAPGGG